MKQIFDNYERFALRWIILGALVLFSLAVAGQPGSLSQSVYRSRVNDSTTVVGSTASGYSYFFWNNQATTPHWDFWNGSTLQHIFEFGSGTGSGAGLVDADYGDITVSGSGTVMNIDAGVVTGTEIASDVALAGNPTTTTQSAGNNSTRIATTAYADALVANSITNGVTASAPNQDQVFDALALKADLASPTFTGTPTLPVGTITDDEAYDATNWNGDTAPASKNAVRDKIETLAAGVIDQASASTAGGTITLDMNSQLQRSFVGSATFATPKTIAISNVLSGSTQPVFFNFFFEVTNTAAVLTLPSDAKMSSIDWDGTDWTPPNTGIYEMAGSYNNTGDYWSVKIYGPEN